MRKKKKVLLKKLIKPVFSLNFLESPESSKDIFFVNSTNYFKYNRFNKGSSKNFST